MRLYFARHGESEANVLREISNRGQQHRLTEKGQQQAQASAAELLPAAITAIYTSPLLRAVQTAEILSQALGVGFEVTDALREYDCGILEGTSGPETWGTFWALREAWWPGRHGARRIEGGESFLRHAGALRAVHRWIFWQQTINATRTLVLIGHGGLYLSMLPLVLVNVDFEFAGASRSRTLAPCWPNRSRRASHKGSFAAMVRNAGRITLSYVLCGREGVT